ncbi:hypothetical protein E3N88_12246 [Mikania micrantha]|uniref:Uncharacterized protein n=1 Tax=Mikania micrantha TaxID=192012 RepID=A0A5N6P6A0_9ASTR|nr:hypothetical protein E3N88_12246 [Mikania micrantha]
MARSGDKEDGWEDYRSKSNRRKTKTTATRRPTSTTFFVSNLPKDRYALESLSPIYGDIYSGCICSSEKRQRWEDEPADARGNGDWWAAGDESSNRKMRGLPPNLRSTYTISSRHLDSIALLSRSVAIRLRHFNLNLCLLQYYKCKMPYNLDDNGSMWLHRLVGCRTSNYIAGI